MKPENIEKWIKDTDIDTNAGMDELVLDDVLRALEQSKEQKSAAIQPSVWRTIMKSKITKLAAAAVIAIAVMLPLSYGAAKMIKYFTISGVRIAVKNSDKINTEEDAKNALEDFGKLYREGKAKEVKPGVWVVTLSNGEEFAYSGDNPEWAGLSPDEKNKLLKAQSNEIQKLRKAGKYERTFIRETEENGVKIRLYEDRFTLSSGKVVTMTFGEEMKKQ